MSSLFLTQAFAPMPSNFRLGVGLAVSTLVHLMLVAGVRPLTAPYAPPTPLQVEIQHLAGEPYAPLASPAPSDFPVSGLPLPAAVETRQPPAPVRPGAVAENQDNPGLALDQYYTSSELDVRAEPLNEVDLIYPQRAYQSRTRGKVAVRILINERGGIDDVTVLRAEPRGVFEEAALAATRALQYSPAMRHGRSVKSQKTVEVAFDPYARINTP